MELKEMISQLLESEIQQNKELAVGLMQNELLSDQERDSFLEIFEKMVNNGSIFQQGNENLLSLWLDVYEPRMLHIMKQKRITKIT